MSTPFAWDRLLMIGFAVAELVLGIILLSNVGQISRHITNEVTPNINSYTNLLNDKKEDLRDSVQVMVSWSMGMAILSLVSVVVVSLYYTLGKSLNYYMENMSTMKPDSVVYKVVKMIIIALGALGIVGIVASMSMLSGTSVAVYNMQFKLDKDKKATLELFMSSVVIGLVILILKLLEALLGHAWAIGLANKHVEMMTAGNGPEYYKS